MTRATDRVDEYAEDRPPLAEERLIDIYLQWRRRHKSEHIPDNQLDAANWWMAHQEKPKDDWAEKPEQVYDKRGHFAGWRTPYHDRVCHNFRVFLSLPEAVKAFVIYNIERGIPWNGDPIEMYKSIIGEHEKMLEDPDAYLRVGEQVRREAVDGVS